MKDAKLGFVERSKWTAAELNGQPAVKCVMHGTDPFRWEMPGTLRAWECEGGMVAGVVFKKGESEPVLWLNQNQADGMTRQPSGDFHVPLN